MRLRAHHKLFLSYGVLIAGVVAALVLGVGSAVRAPLLQRARDDLLRELALANELYERSVGADPASMVRELARITDHRVTLLTRGGDILADSEAGSVAAAEPGSDAGRPEVTAALADGMGVAVRPASASGEEAVFAATLTTDGLVLRFAESVEPIDAAVTRARSQLVLAGVLALLIAAVLSYGFGLSLTRPLRRIREATAALGSDRIAARVRNARDDDPAELGAALQGLADELQQRLAQLEGEREEMNALIDSMAEGVLAIGPDGALRRANPAARVMFDLREEIGGLPPEAIARRKPFLELVSRVLDGAPVPPVELTHDEKHLVATAQPLPRGGAVLVFLDTSELRRLEGVRRDFVANASHELKTPLTVIRGHAETLLDENLPPALRAQFGESLRANVDRLQSILDDLLDLSRIESGGWRMTPESLDLQDVVEESWETFAAAAAERRVGFGLTLREGAEEIEADPGALRQIFSNLFSNALRYTPPGGRIDVVATALRGGGVQIEVHDTGTGIPAPHLSRIFERFYRVDPARSRSEGGTGLGLSIVRHLIERHGGRVEAESEVGRGTTIRFSIPRPHPPVSAPPEPAGATL
jgi:two-component system phosphate regulon sensor histidine kinase PhoR